MNGTPSEFGTPTVSPDRDGEVTTDLELDGGVVASVSNETSQPS